MYATYLYACAADVKLIFQKRHKGDFTRTVHYTESQTAGQSMKVGIIEWFG